MSELNFEKGGELYGCYYPALKPVAAAIKESEAPFHSAYYVYEPGNATRYQVLFNTTKTKWGLETVMTLVNFRKSMIIPGKFLSPSQIGYMHEKLDINEGDCYALMPLINNYLEELGS